MATLGSLVLEFKADIGRLQADMNRAVSAVDKGSANMKRAASLARTALVGIGAGISVAGLTSFVKKGIDAADQMGKVAQKTGVTTEALSRLAYAAKINDVELDTLTRGLVKLGTSATKAAEGNDALKKAFGDLGINVLDAGGNLKQSDVLFQEFAETISKLPDGIEKTSRIAAVLGTKLGPALTPLLNQGEKGLKSFADEADRTGQTITDGAAKAADEFNDNLDRLGGLASAAGLKLGNDLVPALTEVTSEFIRAVSEGEGLLRVFKAIPTALSRTVSAGDQERLGQLLLQEIDAERILAAIRKEAPHDITAIEQAEKRLANTRAQISGLKTVLQPEQFGAAPVKGKSPPAKPVPGVSALDQDVLAEPDKPATSAARKALQPVDSAARDAAQARQQAIEAEAGYIRQLRETIAVENDASAAAKARFDLAEGEAKGFSAPGKARILQLAQEIDLLKESAEAQEALGKLAHDREEQAVNDAEALADKRIAVIESLRTPLEQYNEEVRKLSLLKLDDATVQRGLARAREELDGVAESARSANDAVNSLGLTFSSALEDAIVNGAEFKDLLGGIEKDLLRLGTRKLITEPLFGNNAGDSGIVGDLIGKAFEGSGDIFSGISKAFGSFFGGFKAEGGAVDTGKFYVVGEKGPELLIPGSSGTVINSIQTKQLLSSVSTDRAGRAAAAKVLEPQNFGGGLADGGPVAVGKFYRVGERGPELLVAGGSGTIINHALSKQIFGGNRASGGSVESGKFYRVGELGPELLLANNSSNTNVSSNTRGPVSVVINYAAPPRNAQERSSAMQVAAMAGTQVRKALERNT